MGRWYKPQYLNSFPNDHQAFLIDYTWFPHHRIINMFMDETISIYDSVLIIESVLLALTDERFVGTIPF